MRGISSRIAVLALAAWFLGSSAMASVGSSSSRRNKDGMTDEGWTLVVEQDAKSLLARVEVRIRGGSLMDPPDQPGLASFTARALLRGTRTRPYEDLVSDLERIGAKISVQVETDYTALKGIVLAKSLDRFLQILRDILTQPAFDTKEVLTLQNILQGELKADLQDPRTLARYAFMRTMYAGTPLERPVRGTVAGLARITPQNLSKYFKERYVREAMVVGVTSPLKEEDITRKIRTTLKSVPKGSVPAVPFPQPGVKGRKAVIVDRKEMSTSPLYLGVQGTADQDPDQLALDLGNFIFGGDFTSRLMQVLRAQNGWTYGASSGYGQLLPPKGAPTVFSLYTFPSVEFTGLALPEALRLLELYVRKGLSEQEFTAAREALHNGYAFSIDTSEKRLALKFREVMNGRPFETTERYRERLAALSQSSVNQKLAEKTSLKNMVISIVGDAETLAPILKSLPSVESVEVVDIQP